jgi:hypothetical protein
MAMLLGVRHRAVVLDPLEPLERRVVADVLSHGRDEVEERGVRRCDAESTVVLRVDDVEHRCRELGGIDGVGVVDEDAHPPGDPDPVAVRRPEPLVDAVEDVLGELREPALLVEEPDRAGALREEDVGR